MKGKNHMIVSKDAEKASNSTSFKIKILRKLGIEKIYLNIIKAIHNKFTGNIILNSEVEESFSATTKSKTSSVSSLLFNTVQEVPVRVIIGQEKEIEGI